MNEAATSWAWQARLGYAGSALRLGTGWSVSKRLGPRPEKALELYEFEACPFCRKVRETLSFLDLDALIYPCPKGGTRFRPIAEQLSGKTQFPFLVDPNTNTKLLESDDINRYLAATYGTGSRPVMVALGPLTTLTSAGSSFLRRGHGSRTRPSKAPARPLELFSFEASPWCRLVRERLSELELPWLLRNVGKGSPRRAAFSARSGKMQVPWLFDPNTGVAMFESKDICAYLEATYAC